jgi:nucleotide-binding universal stress UspA family protein
MYRSILVAVDGSPSAERALETAIGLARTHRARLTLIAVAYSIRWRFASNGLVPFVVPYPTDEELEQEAQRIVDRAAAHVPTDLPVKTVVGRGPAAKAILKRVEAAEHDLVVLGSGRHGTAVSLLLGSVGGEVSAQSPVPVIVVHRGGSVTHGLPHPVAA